MVILLNRETVHSETYATLLDALVSNPSEKLSLFGAINCSGSISAKASWCEKWIENESSPFAERLVAFAAVEGIFFSSSFAAIFWIKRRGLMPGLTFSNELIARDEALHTEFAALLLAHLNYKPSAETVCQIIKSAVELEKRFVEGQIYIHFVLSD